MPDNPLSGLYPQPQQQQKPLDPFQAIGALSNVLSFQKNQLELEANKAIGEEYRKAIGPNGLDVGKLGGGLRSNLAAAYGLPEAASRMISQQGGQISNRGGQIENTTKQFTQLLGMNSVLTNGIASLANDPELTKEKVLHWATTTARTTGIPGAVIGPWVTSLSDNPAQLRDQVRTLLAAGLGPAGVAQRVEGPPGPGGRPSSIPAGAAIYGGGGVGGAPGQVYTGNPIGSGESAGAYQADLRRAGNFKQDVFPLERALDLAKKLGPGGMAPGSKGRQEFESYVYGLMPSLVPEGMREKIKNYAELEKYLVNNTSQRAQNLGPHTNEGLAQATTGSPNVHINDLAGVDLIKAQLALRRMEHAQTMQASKAGPANYTNEKARFSAQHEPSAYSIDLMEPEQIAKLKKTLKGADRERFNASLRQAIDSGAIVKQ